MSSFSTTMPSLMARSSSFAAGARVPARPAAGVVRPVRGSVAVEAKVFALVEPKLQRASTMHHNRIEVYPCHTFWLHLDSVAGLVAANT
eukprot:scaffold138409_cov52-Prasinocladus_malaysianus.AAC.1